MRQFIKIPGFLLLLTIAVSCKKVNQSNVCFENETTSGQIVNKPATIKLINNQFYIIEQGTIDTRLNPCNLPEEFKVDNLQVTISGDVKTTIYNPGEPCCTENFVITKIVK